MLVRGYDVVKTADRLSVAVGTRLTYTVTLTNLGTADYTANAPASFVDDMSDVIDDATYNNDATG